MTLNQQDKKEQLEVLFDEFKNLSIELILSSEALFINDEEAEEAQAEPYSKSGKASKVEVLKAMVVQFKNLKKVLEASR
jgi:hypothetical protein